VPGSDCILALPPLEGESAAAAVQRQISRLNCGDFSKKENRIDSSNSVVKGRFKAICAAIGLLWPDSVQLGPIPG